jgi:hypothetical protein
LSMYIPQLQILLTPMHNMTRKNSIWKWDTEMDKIFNEIKILIITAPILSLPSSDGLIKIYVDTSRTGTGSCLVQEQDGQEKILAFYSKKLPEAAKRYTVTKLEAAGMLVNIIAFRYILHDKYFHVVTDHSSLVQIAHSKQEPPSLRIKKIFERLSAYRFDIYYKKGSELVISDYLSELVISDYLLFLITC